MAVCESEAVAAGVVSSPTISVPPPSSPYHSQLTELQHAPAAVVPPLALNPSWSAIQRTIAATYNRLGALIRLLAAKVNVPIAAALAVWYVESSGVALTPNRALIRFEVGRFFTAWGSAQRSLFDAHFECGGCNGISGDSWKNHRFRVTAGGAFVPVHQSQDSEYAALQLANGLAGPEVAVRCISIGGCQIMVSNYAMLGYASGLAMYQAFQAGENAHVLGFFDFCAHQAGGLFGYLRQQDFHSFALHYNGPGQVSLYAAKLQGATDDANHVLGLSKSPPSAAG